MEPMSRRPGSHVDDAPWSGPAIGNGGWSRQLRSEAIRYRVGCGGLVCALVVSWWGNGPPRRCGPPIRETLGHAGGWTPAARPSGSAVAFIALEATPEKQDRPLESRPSWWIRKRASFFGGDARVPSFGGNSEAATPSAGMHQSWCSKGDGCPPGWCG